jgi:hypothetical protein
MAVVNLVILSGTAPVFKALLELWHHVEGLNHVEGLKHVEVLKHVEGLMISRLFTAMSVGVVDISLWTVLQILCLCVVASDVENF